MEYATLLELLQNLHSAGGVESDEILLYLQQFKEGFLKLLDFKVRSANLRAQPAGAAQAGSLRLPVCAYIVRSLTRMLPGSTGPLAGVAAPGAVAQGHHCQVRGPGA